MLTLHGAGVGNGIAIGVAVVLSREQPDIPEYSIKKNQVDDESLRFSAAITAAKQGLVKIHQELPSDAPAEIASFIDAHLMMLEDPVLAEEPIRTIEQQLCNAEWALKCSADKLIAVFKSMEDSYLQSKSIDIVQVVDRVQDNLLGIQESGSRDFNQDLEGRIVVTNDLSPADTVLFRHRRMAAFLTNLGGPISHTAILARSLHIPAIVGLHGATRYLRTNDVLIVDGRSGVIIVNPDQRALAEYHEHQEEEIQLKRELATLKDKASVTKDGEPVTLLANIELPEELHEVKDVAAQGVGLYRTEYLFMNREPPPDEEEQYQAYSLVIKDIKGPVTIRTLDLGADKQVDGGRTESGKNITNPALGLRAVRLCLNEPGLFKPQLRAILRASNHGPVEIMIPMLSSVNELFQVLELIDQVKHELTKENQRFNPEIPIGGIIEVPAAAVTADLFAEHLDFLSIGTNDLIQYTLAIDRVDDDVNYLYDPLHPAVLRLIRSIIEAGEQANIPVSMCGEMAGDPLYTRLLLGLGLRVFSMEPFSLPEIKKTIRESDIASLKADTAKLLGISDPLTLRQQVEQMNRQE